MAKEIKCKNCGNVVDINTNEIARRLDDILVLIQFGTDEKVIHLSLLSILDSCVQCCAKPDYY